MYVSLRIRLTSAGLPRQIAGTAKELRTMRILSFWGWMFCLTVTLTTVFVAGAAVECVRLFLIP
jgi:hypothetical protein